MLRLTRRLEPDSKKPPPVLIANAQRVQCSKIQPEDEFAKRFNLIGS
jgi:hypothetical protein